MNLSLTAPEHIMFYKSYGNRNIKNGNTQKGIFIPASIPESYEYYHAVAGLLTYSPWPGLPV